MAVSASITSKNFAAVVRRLKGNDAAVLPAAAKALNDGLHEATGVIQTEFLQGPRKAKLGEVSGRLRDSINHEVTLTDKGVVGRIGTNLVYGAYHEFGFKGTIQVRAFQRHVEDRNWSSGGPARLNREIIDREGRVVGHRKESIDQAKKRGVEFITEEVKAHSRTVDYAGRPYVRPGLAKSMDRIAALIKTAISEALNGPGKGSAT